MVYKVPFVNYPLHYKNMEKEIDAAIKEVLSRGDLIMRRQMLDFENSMASFLGVKYGIGVNSCTDALIFCLMAAGIKPGDEVITVAHTFVATIEAVVHSGATPVLADVGEDFNMDADKIEQLITPRTRAILPVHFNGRVCDMEKIMKIAEKHNLIIIEDSAQALGATFSGKKGGSFGLAGCFSFYPAKILGAAGDGGLVSTDSADLAEKIRFLRDHGRKGKDEVVCYGFTSRLDNLQAAILNVKFRYLPGWIKRRRHIAGLYDKGLKATTRVKLPPAPGSDRRYFDIYQNYVSRADKRDELALYLKENGVEIIISNPIPVHHQKALGLSHFRLPNTEQFAKEVISIPNIPELTDEQVQYVIREIKDFYK